MLAMVSLTMAWVLFHGYVAVIVWTRGDEFLRSGNPTDAERYYRRALAIDADSRDALDRLLFAATELKKKPDLDRAISNGDRYLIRHPDDVEIRIDRALAMLVDHRYGIAAQEFRWLARRLHDERFSRLASHASTRLSGEKRT